jgi:peroxiredoxin Q/BCP
MLAPGTRAPDFALPDHRGDIVRLEGLRGTWVVLWWYPKASSGVCSIQGRGFQSTWDSFEAAGAVVVGISFDSPEDNCAFADAEGFGFSLLSDPDATTGVPFGVLRDELDLLARAKRITYLIDPEGIVRKAYDVGGDPERAARHAEEVATDLSELQSKA